jgi:hypothetical protein
VRRLFRKLKDLPLSLREILEHLRGYPELKSKFLLKEGYPLDLKNPKTLNEKIQVRKLYDRNPIYPVLSDKLRMREYVASRLGQETVDDLFPAVLGVTTNPTKNWLKAQGDGIVIKANHGSSMHKLILPGKKVDYNALSKDCHRWLLTDYGRERREWAYRPIPRRIFAERLLCFPDGAAADDIKFTVFDGRVHFAQINHGKYQKHSDKLQKYVHAFVTRDWKRLDIRRKKPVMADLPDRPVQFNEMVRIAEHIGKGFDYLRVDFLYSGDRMALGELTLYSNSGFTDFAPSEFGLELGRAWKQTIWRPSIMRGANQTPGPGAN